MTGLPRPPGAAASLARRRPSSADSAPGALSPRRLRLLPSTYQRGDIKSQQTASAQTMALLGGREKRMAMRLLERDHELATLDALLGEITTDQGQIALISGEAGIGKTTLVERFLAQAREGRQPARIQWAACEALFTPRPLGPFYDIARQTASPLRALLDNNANRAALFAAVLDDLTSTPTVLVIEDIHWADEATLDLIKYLGRR